MYYIWKRALYGNKKAFICKLENLSDNGNFTLHKRELNIPPEGLIYNAFDNYLEPEDYPASGTIFNFLVSNKIVKVLKAFDLNIQYFPSKIIRDDGNEFNEYQTINILHTVHCVDMKKSKITQIDLGDEVVTMVDRIVLDESKIPEDEKLFWLGESGSVLVVHQDIVDCLEKADVTGLRFITPEEYR